MICFRKLLLNQSLISWVKDTYFRFVYLFQDPTYPI